MLLHKIKQLLGKYKENPTYTPYETMEIEAVIKHSAGGYCLEFNVLNQGSFFTRDIFIQNVDDKARLELFYNYSALGMNHEDLQKFGATHKAAYRFHSLEDAKKAKETTIQYIRFLIKEHQQIYQSKIS
jgi:hypothetical protein